MYDKRLDAIIQAFPPRERDEARETIEHWRDRWNAASAEIMGMADRPRNSAYREAIYAALKAAPPDGFTIAFAEMMDVSLGNARRQMESTVANVRVAVDEYRRPTRPEEV